MPLLDLIVLASSRKGGGRCVAGYDLNSDRWVRPITDLHEGTLGLEHCSIEGDWPQVYDVVRFEVSEPRPVPWQPENWLLTNRPWELIERSNAANLADDLRSLINEDTTLLDNTSRKIARAALEQTPIDASLTLVRPSTLNWRIERTPWGSRQQKASFELADCGWFDLHVTDPPIEAQLASLTEGSHPRDAVGINEDSDVLLTLSLSEPYATNNDCYKLVAAVLELPSDG
jgi:hypothetical protein